MLKSRRWRRQVHSSVMRSGTSRRSAAAALALVVTMVQVGTASLLPDFTVDLNPVSSRIKKPLLLVGDKLTGSYNQVFTFNGDGTFAAEGYWDVGQLVHGDGSTPYTANISRLGVDYALYAVFSYAGTFVSEGAGGRLSAVSGSMGLHLDRGANTVKTLPDIAPGPIALNMSRDDALLATATLIGGAGYVRLDAFANGDFGLLFDALELTTLGEQYFVAPTPWDRGMQLKGHLNSFGGNSTQHINGSADAVLTP